jgi:acetoacetate decarboxylase
MSTNGLTPPGEIAGVPKLVIRYRTNERCIEALLPPGLEPSGEPIVQIGIYCIPVHGQPEHGVSTKVPARFGGVEGWYTLGIGIDQESAIFISRETNGQPKFPCDVHYYRHGGRIEARCTHQGYTFLRFSGALTGDVTRSEEPFDDHEWWIKVSRAVGGAEQQYDFPPHVVDVRSAGVVTRAEAVEGSFTLSDSPWDPFTTLLPVSGPWSAELVTARHTARDITRAGPLDPIAFWPYADTIGGSRWPGHRGAPPPAPLDRLDSTDGGSR